MLQMSITKQSDTRYVSYPKLNMKLFILTVVEINKETFYKAKDW